MALGPIRPRFEMVVPGTVEEQISVVEAAVARPDSRCVSRVVDNHLDITVVRAERHRWSPCIQLEFRQSGDETVVNGLVGPHPNLWTFYAFVNITVALAMLFGLMTALAQVTLDLSPWALWTVAGGAVVLAGMYLVSQIGQRLAAEQTRMLSDLVGGALRSSARPDPSDRSAPG